MGAIPNDKLLIPQLVNPHLQHEDFEIVHTVLQVWDAWLMYLVDRALLYFYQFFHDVIINGILLP